MRASRRQRASTPPRRGPVEKGWRVEWWNPDTNRREVYRPDLTRAAADRLCDRVRYVMGPRWFGFNPEAWVVPAAAPLPEGGV